jgi:hypothetical protein
MAVLMLETMRRCPYVCGIPMRAATQSRGYHLAIQSVCIAAISLSCLVTMLKRPYPGLPSGAKFIPAFGIRRK